MHLHRTAGLRCCFIFIRRYHKSMKTKLFAALGLLAVVLVVVAADVGGIGLIIVDRKDANEPLRTGNALPGSPAERAGIRPQSFLISINGTNVVSLSLTQALSMVRGPVGTQVTLELADSTMSLTNKFALQRGKMVFSKGKVEITNQGACERRRTSRVSHAGSPSRGEPGHWPGMAARHARHVRQVRASAIKRGKGRI